MKKKQKQGICKWGMRIAAMAAITSVIWLAYIRGSDFIAAAAIGASLMVMLIYAEGELWIQKAGWVRSVQKKREKSHKHLSGQFARDTKDLDKKVQRLEEKMSQLKKKPDTK